MGQFGDAIMAGMGGMASGVAGGLLGLALEGHNDRRQIRQQQKLTDMQQKANMEMGTFNQGLQKEMWDYTNYENQRKHLEDAGLNPGLLYGMGGGGGQTTGSAGGSGVSGSQAPSGGGEIMGLMGQSLQASLLASQIELNKSAANKNNADAGYTGGVKTQETTQNIENLKTQAKNTEAQTTLANIQSEIQKVDLEIKTASKENVIATIQQTLQKMVQDVNNAVRTNAIGDELYKTTINAAKADLAYTIAKTALTRQEITESGSKIKLNEAQINTWAQQLSQNFYKMMQEGHQMDREYGQRENARFAEGLDSTNPANQPILKDIWNLFFLSGLFGKGERTQVEGFKSKY